MKTCFKIYGGKDNPIHGNIETLNYVNSCGKATFVI